MMVANSFDLWQKDVFFSAAEDVQESADIMESAYRLWIKEKSKARISTELPELCKELQAALGTAKWQLEEFVRAIRLSNGHNCRDDTTLTRHKQFISAIENQINRVESSLQEDGKQPLSWIDLNDEERDDLAMFLSGSSQTSDSFNSEIIDSTTTSSDCVIEIEKNRIPDPKPRLQTDKTTSTRRTWSSPNVSTLNSLRIHLPIQKDELGLQRTESTPKEKGFKQRSCNFVNQIFERVNCFERRRIQSLVHSVRLLVSRPVQLILCLVLMLFLLLILRG